MTDIEKVKFLKEKAVEIKKDLFRLCNKSVIHIGGDLSMADIMTALFFYGMKHDSKNPDWPQRDRFILSKGHGAVCYFVILAHAGYFTFEYLFDNFDKYGSKFGIHPSSEIPGVEISTGSLGHGLSISIGIALAARLNKQKHRIFTLLGDGEIQEGSIWEAAMAAPNYKLGNLVAFIDRNYLSLDGKTEELMKIEPVADKWKAFGWNVIEINGHDFEALVNVIDNLPDPSAEKPTMVVAKTIKGKGIKCMENEVDWHAGSVNNELMNQCMMEIDKNN